MVTLGFGSGSKGWRVCACTRLAGGRAAMCNTQKAAGPGSCVLLLPSGCVLILSQSALFSARIPVHSALPAWSAFFSSCHLSYTTFHHKFLLLCSVGLVLGICLFNQPLLPPSAQECSRLSAFEGENLYLSPPFNSMPGMCGLGQLLSPCGWTEGKLRPALTAIIWLPDFLVCAISWTYLNAVSWETMLRSEQINDHPGNGDHRASTGSQRVS